MKYKPWDNLWLMAFAFKLSGGLFRLIDVAKVTHELKYLIIFD